MNKKALAYKLSEDIKNIGWIDKSDSDELVLLNKDDADELINRLALMQPDLSIRKNLFVVSSLGNIDYDSRLMTLCIWASFNPAVEKRFNPKNIIQPNSLNS